MPERDDCLEASALIRPPDGGMVLGVIFAGGASSRFGQDKTMAKLDGIPLLQRAGDRFGPQVAKLVLSGPPRPEFPYPNIPDHQRGAGPLAAFCSVLRVAARQDWPLVATISGDTPFIPDGMVDRLAMALTNHDCAVASRQGSRHPTCALWATRNCNGIQAAFDAGERSLGGAMVRLNTIEVDFSDIMGGPGGDPFFNINSQEDMVAAEAWLSERQQTG